MVPVPLHFKHVPSSLNPAIIESWCLECGVFVAASKDVKKLQAAENSHPCARPVKSAVTQSARSGDSI